MERKDVEADNNDLQTDFYKEKGNKKIPLAMTMDVSDDTPAEVEIDEHLRMRHLLRRFYKIKKLSER